MSLYGFTLLDESFFPESTMTMFRVEYWLPQGTDIRQTSQDLEKIEKHVQTLQGVKEVSTYVGSGALRFTLIYSPEDNNESYGLLLVNTDDYRHIDGLMDQVDQYIKNNFPKAEAQMQRFVMGTGAGAKIQVRVSGPDPGVLRSISNQVIDIMHANGNAKHIHTDWRNKVKVIQPEYSEVKARRAGITRENVADALRSNFTGLQVGVYREKDEIIPIKLRAPDNERLEVSEINNIQIMSPISNSMLPLRQILDGFKTVFEDPIIKRYNRRRTIMVKADPKHGNASGLLDEMMPAINAIKLPSGYMIEYGGEYEDSADAKKALASNAPLVFVSMVLLVIFLFNSLRKPLIIWLCVPLSFIGVTAGLLTTGQSFGFMALLGFLSLSGMLIKNAIVLLEQIDININEGMQPMAAVIDSAMSRMRPVSMAALTTVLGMIPLLFDNFFVSMAVTIMFGLAFATILTLVVVPVFYTIFYRVR